MLCVLIRIASSIFCRRSIDFPELAIFASRPGAMINLHWLELPMARTLFHGPKCGRAIEVRLYMYNPVSILRKYITGRYRPVRIADVPITAHCRFINNAIWEMTHFFNLVCEKFSKPLFIKLCT